jgi:hypothetical protein
MGAARKGDANSNNSPLRLAETPSLLRFQLHMLNAIFATGQ